MNLNLDETTKITVVFDKTASHNVDPQKGFTNICPNELPVPDGENIVSELNGQNGIVAYKTVSKDMHPLNAIWIATPGEPQFSHISGENVDFRWNSHCISGTKGSELLDGLGSITNYDFIAVKGTEPDLHPYSSCYQDLKKKISTGLIEWYNSKGISTIIVGGLALNSEDTPLCVGETVIDLVNAGFQVILNLGSTRGLGSEEGRNKFINMLVDTYGVLIVESFTDIEVITD